MRLLVDVDLAAHLVESNDTLFSVHDDIVEAVVVAAGDVVEAILLFDGVLPLALLPVELLGAVLAVIAPGLPEGLLGRGGGIEVLPTL